MRYGFILLVIGVIFLLSNYGIWGLSWSRDWPWILVVLGIYYIVKHLFYKNKKATRIVNRMTKEERVSVLKKLQKGEITVEEAMDKLKGGNDE